MDSEGHKLSQLISEMEALMKAYSPALELRAAKLEASGKDSELANKLMRGADVMRDSGNIYLTWAHHYAALSEGNAEASEATDEPEFSV